MKGCREGNQKRQFYQLPTHLHCPSVFPGRITGSPGHPHSSCSSVLLSPGTTLTDWSGATGQRSVTSPSLRAAVALGAASPTGCVTAVCLQSSTQLSASRAAVLPPTLAPGHTATPPTHRALRLHQCPWSPGSQGPGGRATPHPPGSPGGRGARKALSRVTRRVRLQPWLLWIQKPGQPHFPFPRTHCLRPHPATQGLSTLAGRT